MLNKVKIKICVLVVALVQAAAMLAGCSIFPSEEEPAIPALKTPKPIEYSFYRVKKDTLRSTAAGIGTVTSIYYTEYSFPFGGGKVKNCNVTLGQYVEAGEPLLELDNSELEIEFLQAQLDYEKQNLLFAQQERNYRNGSISETEYKIAQLERSSALKKYEKIKAAYESTVIMSTVSGKIVYLNTDYTTGSKEIVGGERVLAIDPEDPKYTYLVFDHNEPEGAYAPQFRIGNKLTLTMVDSKGAAIPGMPPFTGTIVGTDAILRETGLDENAIKKDKYYCKMENPPEGAGTNALVKYDYTEFEIEDCLIIPASALYEFNGNHFVYMLDGNTNLKKEVPVEIGYRTSTQVQVLDGLKAGDMIIEG